MIADPETSTDICFFRHIGGLWEAHDGPKLQPNLKPTQCQEGSSTEYWDTINLCKLSKSQAIHCIMPHSHNVESWYLLWITQGFHVASSYLSVLYSNAWYEIVETYTSSSCGGYDIWSMSSWTSNLYLVQDVGTIKSARKWYLPVPCLSNRSMLHMIQLINENLSFIPKLWT